ncbi:hypothetical protein [Helicobacter pylori]|uniref:hypothetical protein n=1 Tax=Helicobacter pylori TaxID=210 RepID=UPI00026B238A|nr:hypothetical protein [Helicobacter pylori]EJC15312.1 hypothetical protein HPHPP25_0471 [Helicobacter pylori Hp P-25]EJC34987.1 hypothetical protein HPHPP25C_0315 [Helicobacter pylori Hp P-25c]EJC38771.1 hypothetical protein HPHPP25D_0451 [Helicobacter pylori Hp P-25d]
MQEKIIKIIPGLLFLFCVLSVFELVLIIEDMNKTEKLEAEVKKNLEVIETIAKLLNEHLEGMELEKPEIKIFKNKIK